MLSNWPPLSASMIESLFVKSTDAVCIPTFPKLPMRWVLSKFLSTATGAGFAAFAPATAPLATLAAPLPTAAIPLPTALTPLPSALPITCPVVAFCISASAPLVGYPLVASHLIRTSGSAFCLLCPRNI